VLDYELPNEDDADRDEFDSSVTTAVQAGAIPVRVAGSRLTRPSRMRDGAEAAVKRARYFRRKYAVERVVAWGMLIGSLPVIAVLVWLVRRTSEGAGIYKQERVGLHGETFMVYKLRSMYIDAEKGGKMVWSGKGDPRVTPLGRFLRKTHLDELPQLWNVANGEMSLTGPRPERPKICEELAKYIDDYERRTIVKPGVTGLAQINLEPDQTIADAKRKQYLDIHYIENANAWLDVRMVMATCLRMFWIKGSTVMKLMGLCRIDLVNRTVVTTPEDDRPPFAVAPANDCCQQSCEQSQDAGGQTAPKRPR
jgi:lipopolysaccharide/colanic/teichoic acid biosynthesis glycosyltransferase